jgi:hypothetical protein
MGSVFGKENVEEPAFECVLSRKQQVDTPYEIRKYGKRFAAEVSYSGDPEDRKNANKPFWTLAEYIGVFGKPQNESAKSISMTAPVAMEGTPIAMTAPVAMESDDKGENCTMKFFLPAEYDDLSKIPKPVNPAVKIQEIPPQTGAVHRFSGYRSQEKNQKIAKEIAQQLMADGVDGMSEDHVLQNYEYWGYNPPFTLPMFRRNEVWISLTQSQVDHLINKFEADAPN